MICWLLWTSLFFVVTANPAADPAVAADVAVAADPAVVADPVVAKESVRRDDYYEQSRSYDSRDEKHYDGDRKYSEYSDIEPIGPNVKRVLNPEQIAFDPQNKYHRRIIDFTYGPDYYQPTWILDYRYLKTGGREYTRSDGGQILILPKGIKSDEPTRFRDYDELLEFLRLKQLAEANKHYRHGHRERDYEYGRYGYGREHGYEREHGYGREPEYGRERELEYGREREREHENRRGYEDYDRKEQRTLFNSSLKYLPPL